MPTRIDEFAPQYKPVWRRLYQGYADFYKTPMTDETAELYFASLGHLLRTSSASQLPREERRAFPQTTDGLPRPFRAGQVAVRVSLTVAREARRKTHEQ